MKKRILMASILGGTAVLFTVILKSEALPFNDYLYESPVLTAMFGLLNLPVLVVLVLTRVDYPPFALLLIFIQWFLIGILVPSVFARIRR